MATRRSANRGRVAIALAIGLAVVACGSSSPSAKPSGMGGVGNAGSSGSGTSLAAGLSSNLNKLDSYQFFESMPTSSTGSSASGSASPGGTDQLSISGTVVNKPVRSIYVNGRPAQFIVIGDQAWRSLDGNTWTAGDPVDPFLTDLLPGHDYVTWFDAKASYFRVVGEEKKNGVDCIRYKGDPSLGGLYAGAAATSANFGADLWIAKSGDYPVSGVYGFTDTAGDQGGSWGFSFDITHANDPANMVLAPTNVIPVPT